MGELLHLARHLLRFDTRNPPGQEAPCARFAAGVLEAAGFRTRVFPMAEDRANLVARLDGADADLPPVVFTGHLDTVPLGAAPWLHDPFAGETAGGRLYGRGAADMKGAVAAMILACAQAAARGTPRRGVQIVLTSGEETGCEGARALVAEREALLGAAHVLVVGEPTANRIGVAHKGCLCLRARFRGVTAHASMPHQGHNAIYAAARAVSRVEAAAGALHDDPRLGGCTANVGLFTGGLNANSVPDAAEFTLDMRTDGVQAHGRSRAWTMAVLGPEAEADTLIDLPPVATSRSDARVAEAAAIVSAVMGAERGEFLTLPFFTDAAVLAPRLAAPTIILGPGEPAAAHQTDEWCELAALDQAAEIYGELIGRWCA